MADSGERRMLFDTRGRRRNVIRVVYATLALLMGGSLFLTVGPFNISELIGSGGGSSDNAAIFHDQAERIEEQRLAKNPNDEEALLALTRARIEAGRAQTDIDPQTGFPGTPPAEAQDDYDAAVESWERYVKLAGDGANPGAAQLVAQTYFGLAERGSVSFGDVQENLEIALGAQRIAAANLPNAGTLSNLAIYEYFNGNFKAGDRAAKRVLALAPKPEAKSAEKQLDEFRKNAKRYVAQTERFEKAEEQAGGGAGGDFQNPFGGFGAGTPGAPAE